MYARPTSHLKTLMARYKTWKERHPTDSESEDESEEDIDNDNQNTDYDDTVSSPLYIQTHTLSLLSLSLSLSLSRLSYPLYFHQIQITDSHFHFSFICRNNDAFSKSKSSNKMNKSPQQRKRHNDQTSDVFEDESPPLKIPHTPKKIVCDWDDIDETENPTQMQYIHSFLFHINTTNDNNNNND
jgi:hypothetical protein